MADTLRIKRRVSGAPGAPSGLANAELAYNEVDHTLYYGEGTGGAGGSATVVVPIGGSGLGSSATPLMDGVAAPGTAALHSRGDHVHPTDTSRQPAGNYPTITGGAAANNIAMWVNGTAIGGNPPNFWTINSWGAPTADVPWNSKRITGLLDPSAAQDAATKNYVDGVAQGIDAKPSVRAATTASITLSGLQSVDSVSLNANDRVLVKDQTTANGIYLAQSGAWTRAPDLDTWAEAISAYVFVELGAINADSGWLCTADQGGVLGTSPMPWVQFSGAGQISAGAGLTKTGSQLDVVGTAGRISVAADSIDIDATYAGQASITIVGNVVQGTWSGSTVQVNKGGTGTTTLTGYIKGAGSTAFTASPTIPSADISGLGSMALQNANAVAITGGTIDGVTLDCGTF